jgi:hypothetical protein
MNTLPRAVNAQFFSNPDSYNALRHHWSSLINSERKHTLSAAHHLLYLALLGKDWRKAYTCVSNPRKLANGAFAGWALFRAIGRLHSSLSEAELLAPFDGLVTTAMLKTLRSLLPSTQTMYGLRLEQFADGTFPFDAYIESTIITMTKGNLHG